jgi:hypothetical protein
MEYCGIEMDMEIGEDVSILISMPWMRKQSILSETMTWELISAIEEDVEMLDQESIRL